MAAVLLCLKWLLVPLVAGILTYSIIKEDHELTIFSIGLGGTTVLVALIQYLVAVRARCPLCMTPVLSTKGCSKHRNARTVMGSHSLRVALAVVFRGCFHCPYCHEPAIMEVRARRLEGHARARHL